MSLGSLTSAKGINGGPDAISAALVPGRILLTALSLIFEIPAASGNVLNGGERPGKLVFDNAFIGGDLRPIWTSGMGGGLGSRGEVDGDRAPILAAMFIEFSKSDQEEQYLVLPGGWLRHEKIIDYTGDGVTASEQGDVTG